MQAVGKPTPTGSTVCHNTTLRSSGARGLDVSRCYRHVAPLERKASQINALHRRVRSPCAGGRGTHPLRVSTVCHNTTLRSSGARGLDVSRCYRHIAPLERKASQINALHRRVRSPCAGGRGTHPLRVSTVCHNTTLRSSGARGLDVSRCYRHVAPLERKASQINALHRRVRSPCAGGRGTHPLRVQPCATIPHCAPLERGDWTCRAAIDMSLLWSERQAKSIPFIVG